MIDAMRMLGEFLKAAPKATGAKGNPGGRGAKIVRSSGGTAQPPTLAESGIAKKESSQAQKLATIAAQGNGLYDEIRGNRKTIAEADRELQRQQKTADLVPSAAGETATWLPETPARWP
jgi:hypothetical protein